MILEPENNKIASVNIDDFNIYYSVEPGSSKS